MDFTSNMSRTLDRQSVYSEKIGNYSTVKMLGFTEILQPYGYVILLQLLGSAFPEQYSTFSSVQLIQSSAAGPERSLAGVSSFPVQHRDLQRCCSLSIRVP